MKFWLGFATLVLASYAEEDTKYSSRPPSTASDSVAAAFRNTTITSDIVPEVPEEIAYLRYITEICLQEVIRETDVIYPPTVWYKYKPGVNYTILLLSLDFPSVAARAIRLALNWLVVNVPGENVADGYTAAVYVPPVNYPGSGCHRYVLLVYAQDKPINTTNKNILRLGVNRFGFSLTEFIEQYGLSVFAGNVFWTCSPPIKTPYYCDI